MSTVRLALFFFASVFSAVTLADEPLPPPKWAEGLVLSETTEVDPVSPLAMGSKAIVLEKTPLAEVLSAVGSGEIHTQGDAGEFVAWLCYTVTSPKTKQRLWLTSSELGGGTIIDGISATEISLTTPPNSKCPELPGKFQPLHLGKNIWLGATAAELQRKLGAVKKAGNLLLYIYSGKQNEYDVMGTLAIEISHSRAIAIHAVHTTTN
jgi:hypothetical protein